MQKTYLFYDLETTGRNKCFDQVLQFAAIRTDRDLQEIERHEIQIKLNNDVIPDPEALLIHKIPVATMLVGELETNAMLKIHALLNTPGTISCGYNTLGFDDEFLRFSFHRNLLTPYTHQWANFCGRMDLFPIAMLYFLFKNTGINWPVLAGKPTLKLEHLASANQLATGNAHTAIVDVEATLALAKLFYKERDMWAYVIGYFDKQIANTRSQQLAVCFQQAAETYRVGLLVGKTGSADAYQFPVLSLGSHYHYKNQTLWLRLDQPNLVNSTAENFLESTWVVNKKAGETGLLLPFTQRFTHHLSAERLEITAHSIEWLKNNPHILHAISDYYREYTYPKIPQVDVDANLYQSGFLTPIEERLCQTFHAAKPEKKVQLLAQFSKPDLQERAMRVLGRQFFDFLTPSLKEKFTNYLSTLNHPDAINSAVDYRGAKRLNTVAALQKLSQLKIDHQLTVTDLQLLDDLEKYLSMTHQIQYV